MYSFFTNWNEKVLIKKSFLLIEIFLYPLLKNKITKNNKNLLINIILTNKRNINNIVYKNNILIKILNINILVKKKIYKITLSSFKNNPYKISFFSYNSYYLTKLEKKWRFFQKNWKFNFLK